MESSSIFDAVTTPIRKFIATRRSSISWLAPKTPSSIDNVTFRSNLKKDLKSDIIQDNAAEETFRILSKDTDNLKDAVFTSLIHSSPMEMNAPRFEEPTLDGFKRFYSKNADYVLRNGKQSLLSRMSAKASLAYSLDIEYFNDEISMNDEQRLEAIAELHCMFTSEESIISIFACVRMKKSDVIVRSDIEALMANFSQKAEEHEIQISNMNVKEDIIVKLLVDKIQPDALRTLVGQKKCQTMMETRKVIREFLRRNDVKDSFIKELNGASKTAAIVNPVNNQSTGGIAAYYKARQGAVATAARAEGSVTQPV